MQTESHFPRLPGAAAADLVLDNVSLGYGKHIALQDVSGQFSQGSLTAIIGPNGSGKSSLLKGLLGLMRPQRGTITSRHSRHALGYLSQAGEVDPQFPVSVEDFVAVGLWPRIGWLGRVTPPLAHRVAQAIQDVGLEGLGKCHIGELSGGQFQRMRFARLMVQDPPVVVLDEPFAGIDEPTTAVLLRLLHAWHNQGKTVIAVLHDRAMVRAHFPQTLALAGRVLAWGDTASVLDGLKSPREPA